MLFFNLLQRARKVVEVVANGLYGCVGKVSETSTKVAAEKLGVVGYKSRSALSEMPFFCCVTGSMEDRAQYKVIG